MKMYSNAIMNDDINEVQSGKTLIWNSLYEDFIFSFLENIDYSECIEHGWKTSVVNQLLMLKSNTMTELLRSDLHI